MTPSTIAADDETWKDNKTCSPDLSKIENRVNDLLSSARTIISSDPKLNAWELLDFYHDLETTLLLMLRYFEIEIDPSLPSLSDSEATHRFHEALLQAVFERESPLQLRLHSSQAFLRDFKNFRNRHKAGRFYSMAKTQKALSEVNFQSRWHNLAFALCEVVKTMKAEAVQRSSRKTAWGRIRIYEFSLQMALTWMGPEISEEVKDTRMLQLQGLAETLRSFADEPTRSLHNLKHLKHQNPAWQERTTIHEARVKEDGRIMELLRGEKDRMEKEKEAKSKALKEQLSSRFKAHQRYKAMAKEKEEESKALKEQLSLGLKAQYVYEALAKAYKDKIEESKKQAEEKLNTQASEISQLRFEVARLKAKTKRKTKDTTCSCRSDLV